MSITFSPLEASGSRERFLDYFALGHIFPPVKGEICWLREKYNDIVLGNLGKDIFKN